MPSLADFAAPVGGPALGITLGANTTLPQYQEDASIGTSRALQNYATRSLPDLQNQGAALGQWGSSGLRNRADRLSQDVGRNVSDIQRMLARNTANLAQQRVLAALGNYGV